MAITIPGTYVYPLVKEWKFEITEQGCTGLRKYIDEDPSYVTPPVELPSIGDPWDDSWPNCRVARIEIEYLGDNDQCPQIYTCHYETIFIDTQALLNDGDPAPTEDGLIISLEQSSELISADPTEGTSTLGFEWDFDGEPVVQPIYFVVNTETIKIQRMLVSLDSFRAASNVCRGCVNDAMFLDKEPEIVLYTGFSAVPHRSETDKIKWRAELTFVIREVTGNTTANNDGWNYIFRETRKTAADPFWQKPRRMDPVTGATYLYKKIDLGVLMLAGAESVDPITSGMLPLE